MSCHIRDNTQRERAALLAVSLWEKQHVLEGLRATGFIPPQACLTQYGGSRLLNGSTWPYASPLSRSDFTGLPSQHPPAVLCTAPSASLLPSLPLLLPNPQPNSSSWILSEWHPLNLPNYLSSGHAAVALSRQRSLLANEAEGPTALQQDILTAHLEGWEPCDAVSSPVSSSNLCAT